MPFYAHYINRLWTVGATLYNVAVIALAINVYVPSVNAALLLYIMVPFAVSAGIAFADARATSVICAASERLSTAYEVELRGRYMLHDFTHGHPLFYAGNMSRLSSATVILSDGDGAQHHLDPEQAAALLAHYRAAVSRFPVCDSYATLHVSQLFLRP